MKAKERKAYNDVLELIYLTSEGANFAGGQCARFFNRDLIDRARKGIEVLREAANRAEALHSVEKACKVVAAQK